MEFIIIRTHLEQNSLQSPEVVARMIEVSAVKQLPPEVVKAHVLTPMRYGQCHTSSRGKFRADGCTFLSIVYSSFICLLRVLCLTK